MNLKEGDILVSRCELEAKRVLRVNKKSFTFAGGENVKNENLSSYYNCNSDEDMTKLLRSNLARFETILEYGHDVGFYADFFERKRLAKMLRTIADEIEKED